MAVVPISQGASVGEVRPAPFVPQQAQYDPSAYGAGVGQAMQGFGRTVGAVSDEANKIATNMAIENDTRAAKVADTQHVKAVTDLGFVSLPGGPAGNKGYYSLQGQDAVTYRPTYQKALEESNTAISEGLKESPRAQNFYANQAGMRLQAEVQRSAEYANHHGLVADNNASTARLGGYKDSLTLNYNDPTALANFQAVTRGEIADTGRRMGWGTDQIAEATTKALSGGYRDAILARAAGGDTLGAASMLASLAPGMDAATRVSLAQHLEPQVIGAKANAWVNARMGQVAPAASGDTAPAGDQSLPRGIRNNNPGNLNFANQDGAMLENHENARFAAFPTMGQGIAALGHQIKLDVGRGHDTIEKLISKYAPSSENDTQGYISALAKSTGYAPTDKLDVSNPKILASLQRGIIAHENGGRYASVVADDGSYQIAGAPVGPPAGNASDANMQKYPDFAGMFGDATDQFKDDPKQLQAVQSRITAAKSQYELQDQAQRDHLEKSAKDTVAALEAGNDTVEIPEAQIRHSFRPGVAEPMIQQMQDARLAGQIFSGMKFATPDQIASSRQDLASGLGPLSDLARMHGKALTTHGDPTAPQTEGDASDFVFRQKLLYKFDQMANQRQTMIDKDPAAYAAQNADVAAAYAAAKQDPSKLSAAIALSQSVQRQIGVRPGQEATLGVADAHAMVQAFQSTPIETADIGAQFNKLEAQYGDAYPGVVKDLAKAGLDEDFQMLAHANLPEQKTVRADLQRALQMKAGLKDKAEFGKAGREDQTRLIKPAIDNALASFQATTAPYGDSRLYDTVVLPSVTTLATYYVGKGMPAADAVEKAAELVTKSYDFSGMLRTPKGYMPAVQQGANVLTTGLKDSDLRGGVTADQARAGTWATRPDDGGVYLLYGTTQGGFNPVRKADGSLVGFDFNKIPKAGPGFLAPDYRLTTQAMQ